MTNSSPHPSVRRRAIASACAAGLAAVGLAAQPALANASVPAFDEHNLQMSIQGDRFEIVAGKLAERRGSAPVRALGHRLVKDHSKSLTEAVRLAKRLDVDVPKAPTPSQLWEIDVLRSYSGHTFDVWYSRLEVNDHRQDIQETSDEIDQGRSRAIRALAKQDLPVLKAHLKLSKATLAKVS
jgi:putative membrane protein